MLSSKRSVMYFLIPFESVFFRRSGYVDVVNFLRVLHVPISMFVCWEDMRENHIQQTSPPGSGIMLLFRRSYNISVNVGRTALIWELLLLPWLQIQNQRRKQQNGFCRSLEDHGWLDSDIKKRDNNCLTETIRLHLVEIEVSSGYQTTRNTDYLFQYYI